MWLCWFTGYDAQGRLSMSSSEYRAFGCWDRLRQTLTHPTKPQLSQTITLQESRLQRSYMAEPATVLAHETCSKTDVWGHLL